TVNITGGTVAGNIVGQSASGTVNFAPGAGNTFTYAAPFGFPGIAQANINSGTVVLNGVNSASAVAVNSGSTLAGTGTVNAAMTTNSGGPWARVTGTPGSSMNVVGSLAFASAAFYRVQVNPLTASSTSVTGTASLAGTVNAIFAPGTYGLVHSYTILTAGLRNGTFDALTTSGLPANFQVSLSHPGNTAVLSLTAAPVPEPPAAGSITAPQLSAAAFTVNQLNVGHAIDNFFNNGGALPPAFLSLFNLTGSNLTNALDQLSGEPATGAQKVAFQLTNQFLDLMLDP